MSGCDAGCYVIFGGAGLVGRAICRELIATLSPRKLVVCSLYEAEAREAITQLRPLAPELEWVPEWGNLFVPHDLARLGRGQLLSTDAHRARLLSSLFDDFEKSYEESFLARLLRRHRPEAVVDAVNTATGISYQDTFEGAAVLRQALASEKGLETPDIETFMLSSAVPQIIRHVRITHRALTDIGARMYLKIGTTGTGGMGLNLPYTHSEDRPSSKLMAKTAVAFSHTGLMFLMARTPGPVVKEIKPAAMIGYRAVEYREVPDRNGQPVQLYQPRPVTLEDGHRLQTRAAPREFHAAGETLKVPVVNTGENGLFALGEFAAITALGQMEFVTPEEIARDVVAELRGANTGHDVIAALDSSVLDPSYRAGFLRDVAIQDLQRLEEQHQSPSVALGKLGPPELSKLLFEIHLLRDRWSDSSMRDFIEHRGGRTVEPQEISAAVARDAAELPLVRTAVSIGVPVLLPDGRTLLRGPRISVPEVRGKDKTALLDDADAIDRCARRGWIDLRPANMKVWQDRFRRMMAARVKLMQQGSAGVGRHTYLHEGIHVGDAVAWVFNNELEGYRVK